MLRYGIVATGSREITEEAVQEAFTTLLGRMRHGPDARLLLFLVAEFLHMMTAAFLIVILFLGGWHFWGITGTTDDVTWWQALLRILVLGAKTMLVIVFFMITRWSWPRFRFDQLMAQGPNLGFPQSSGINGSRLHICGNCGCRAKAGRCAASPRISSAT